MDVIIGAPGAAPELMGVDLAVAFIGQAREMLGDEVVAGVDAQRMIGIFAIALGQTLWPHRFPCHIIDDGQFVLDIEDDLPDKRIARLAAEIAGGDQAGSGNLALPAGEGLAIEKVIVERAEADAIRVHQNATFLIEDFPPHHIRNAVQLAIVHFHDVGGVHPFAAAQFGIAPDFHGPAGIEAHPCLDAVVRALAVVAYPDEMQGLGDRSLTGFGDNRFHLHRGTPFLVVARVADAGSCASFIPLCMGAFIAGFP